MAECSLREPQVHQPEAQVLQRAARADVVPAGPLVDAVPEAVGSEDAVAVLGICNP